MTDQNYLRIDDTILPLVHTILLAITALANLVFLAYVKPHFANNYIYLNTLLA